MKKKILFVLAIMAMLICIFTASASAADNIVTSTSNEFGELTTFDEEIGNTGISNLKDDETIARTVLYDGTNYYTVPTVYILTESPKNSGGQVGEMFLLSFSEINTKLGKSFSKASIIRSEIPSDIDFICNAEVESYNSCENMIEIKINKGLRFWDDHNQRKVFASCKSLKTIDCSEMIFNYAQNTCSVFEYCESLETVILPDAYYKESTGKYMDYKIQYMFNGCKNLKNIVNLDGFMKGTTTIGDSAFKNCTSLKSIELWDGIVKIDQYAFSSCTSIETIVIPDSVTTIGGEQNVFASCTSLKKIVFPKGPVSVGKYCFEKCTALTDVWMPSQASTFNTQVFGQCGSGLAVNFYFQTATNTITVTDTSYKNDPYLSAVNAENDARLKFNTPAETKCVVFFNNHTYDNTKIADIIYASFMDKGVYFYSCPTCDGYEEKTASAPALFTCLGFSTPMYGNDGSIVLGYIIDNEAIASYEQASGKTVSYGTYAALKIKIGTSDMVNTDGESPEGVINANLTGYTLSAFDLKIVGFTTEEHKALEIAMGAYVITSDENGAEVAYLQAGTPAENEKYYFTTYNSEA